MREHRREDYITKMCGTSPNDECQTPKFTRFMNEIFDSNEDLIRYMQKVFGYCVTGITREQQMWFFYGTGSNGKSVLISTIAGVLGDYAITAPIETFTVKGGDEHPTELARLRGARLVTANETEEGRRWSESRIKEMTGGADITARFMRQDYFTFTPQFKLIISGNHKPALRSVNEAIRRRMNLVPFGVTIPTERRNVNLFEEMKLEWPGILHWMVEGCQLWQKEGLEPPEIVKKATDDYLMEEDAIGEFIEERCDLRAGNRCGSSELYKAWKEWSELHGEFTGSQKQFSGKMMDRGFHTKKQEKGKVFIGISLIEAAPRAWND